MAFQWSDGNMILTDGTQFSTYDPYWNVATFTGKTIDYFPGNSHLINTITTVEYALIMSIFRYPK